MQTKITVSENLNAIQFGEDATNYATLTDPTSPLQIKKDNSDIAFIWGLLIGFLACILVFEMILSHSKKVGTQKHE